MDAQTIILGFLTHKSMTGYEIKKKFSLSFSFFSGLSYGSIYPALKKMERQGLITMKLEIQEHAPNKKVYTITEAGRRAFLETLKTPTEDFQCNNPFLQRLFFFAHLSQEQRETAAEKHLEAIRFVARQLETVRPVIEANADFYQYLCFEFGVRFFNDLARNVDETIREIKGKIT